jgi:hypothetical protein
MVVRGRVQQEVYIDPLEVVQRLINESLGGSHLSESDGSYYKVREESAGPHSWEDIVEIPKKEYDYIKALEIVQVNLREKGRINLP